jgi:hypothetical protein
MRRFLRSTLTADEAARRLKERVERREESFLRVLERGVYANPSSPYRQLLEHERIELGDVRRLVHDLGIEGALGRLYDCGIRVSYDEFKGRKSIRRPGLEIRTKAEQFDNPLAKGDYEARTSSSSGMGVRVPYGFDLLGHDSAYVASQFHSRGFMARPILLWRPAPPDSSGVSVALRYAKIGRTPDAWFSQAQLGLNVHGVRAALFLNSTLVGSRLAGHPFPRPRFVPRDQGAVVARWLAERRAAGEPAFVDTSASGATRASLSALKEGLDISGTMFLVGGEPYTEA